MILLLGVVAAAMGPVVVALGWKYVHALAVKMRHDERQAERAARQKAKAIKSE